MSEGRDASSLKSSNDLSSSSLLDTKVKEDSESEKSEDSKDLKMDELSRRSFFDRVQYILENRISSNSFFPFAVLAALTSVFIFTFGSIWFALALQASHSQSTADNNVEDLDVYGNQSWQDSIFMSLQLIISSGYDTDIPNVSGLRFV